MLSARSADRDVLRSGETKDEQTRNDVISLVRTNSSRAQEAIRSMEEFIKLTFPFLSEQSSIISGESGDRRILGSSWDRHA